MHLCYFDESGCVGKLPSTTSPVSPLIAIVAVAFDSSKLHGITTDYLDLKKKYFPKLIPNPKHPLSRIQAEIKGSDLRKILAKPSRNPRRQTARFLHDVLTLLEKSNAKIWGRVWIKKPGTEMNGTALYTSSVQSLYENFQKYLEIHNAHGCVIGDSREAAQNVKVAHAIFTQKYSHAGDIYSRVIEIPSFAHSQNTVGIQLADLLCSGIVNPMATETYCKGYINSLHIRDYAALKNEFADRIRRLQCRFPGQGHLGVPKQKGGIVVADHMNRRPGSLLFQTPNPTEVVVAANHPRLVTDVQTRKRVP